jgi:hypothetical protein
LLHQEISQYGIWDFDFKYVASAKSRSDLHELEKQLIRQYDTVENGFNQTRGGATGETVGNPVTVEGITFISLNAAARHYGVEEYSVHQRMNRYGFSLEEAIGIEYKQKQPRKTNPYEVDGQTFPNFADACRQYGLEDSAVRSRLKIGWTIRQAFGIDMPPQKGRNSYGKSVTIKGAVFRTFADAAREYGLKACTLTSRFRKGWTPEQAVGLEPSPKPITTRKWTFGKAFGLEPQPKKRTGSNRKSIIVEGVVYNSHKEAAEKYGLDHRKIFQRVNKLGWTIEQAFGLEPQAKKRTAPNRKSITVEGVVYNSHKEAAEKYGLDHRKIFKRIYKFGWTIEQAFGLEPPSEKPSNSSKKVMIKSVTYESITAACSAFEIAISTVQRRVKSGWTIEDAVTVPSRKSKK